jgi:hypothetical protein
MDIYRHTPDFSNTRNVREEAKLPAIWREAGSRCGADIEITLKTVLFG